MNAGKDYKAARAQAQANANLDEKARVLSFYGGVFWIDRFDSFTTRIPDEAEIVQPKPRKEA